LGISIDDTESHAKWRQTAISEGGIGEVQYPLLSDPDRALTNSYNVLHEETTFALRGSFLIDKEGTVQHQVVNNLPLGRDIDEMLRIVDALQFHEEHGEVCPAGWASGKPGMTPLPLGLAQYLSDNADSL
jgi:peroxiredoxin (alkyl hydroperoxide reductase subunit C)